MKIEGTLQDRIVGLLDIEAKVADPGKTVASKKGEGARVVGR